jgi:exoribonuclease-2
MTPHGKDTDRDRLRAIARRAMTERGLQPDFGPAVQQELATIHGPILPPAAGQAQGAGLRDQRALLWCSIDNDDSLDLDQLSACEPLADGTVKIFVAIADVDELVHNATAIDGHARHNTTSVYTPADVFAMLPPKLSTNLTTLCESQDRLALTVEMTIAPDGTIQASDIYRALVNNRAKLAYNSIAAWIDGGPAPEHLARVPGMDEQIRIQDRVAQALRTVRYRHGALDLETIEARAVFSDAGVSDLRVEQKNRAKQLIEDLMIAANGVTARFLHDRGFPSLRRVLRAPERWQRLVDLAGQFGELLPAQPDAAALESFLTRRKQADPLRFADLSLTVVKLMGRGEYTVEFPGDQAAGVGHFGLAVRDYTHSTAPNRRYPDLITQRLLKAAIAGQPVPYARAELEELALHCTEMENAAEKVERQCRKAVAAMLLEKRIGERFDAIVTGVNAQGCWVRTLNPPVEGKLVRHTHKLDVGDRVQVQLVRTDAEHGFIDFAAA